jgi:hypothetical protein
VLPQMAQAATSTPGLMPLQAAFHAEQFLPAPSGRAAELQGVLLSRPSCGLDVWDPSGRAAELQGVLLGGTQYGVIEVLPERHLLSAEAAADLPGRHLLDLSGRGVQMREVLQGRHLLDSPLEVPPVGPPLCPGDRGNQASRDVEVSKGGPTQRFPEALPAGRPPRGFEAPPAGGPPRRSEALPAGRPPQSLPLANEVSSSTHDVLLGLHQEGTMTHTCGRRTPLRDVMVPGCSLAAQHQDMSARKGGGCMEHDSAGRAPAPDVPARQHKEMKGVRVTLGQANNLDPAGALTSPYSDQLDVQAAVH